MEPISGYAAMVTGSNGIRFFAESGATTAGGAVNPPARMFINTSGDVGIGTSTPIHKLSVNGTIGAVQQKGVGVGEAQTLHMIKEHDRNNRLEQQNRELQERIARLESAAAATK